MAGGEKLPIMASVTPVGTHDALASTKLSEDEAMRAARNAAVSFGVKLIPGLGSIYELFEKIDDNLRQEKLQRLLNDFARQFAATDEAIAVLNKLFADRTGQILGRKLIQILDRGDPDPAWIEYLSIALKNVATKDFSEHFEELSFALAQLDRLSPPAVVVLAKFDIWTSIKLTGTTTTSGRTICGDWDMQLTNGCVHAGIAPNAPGKKVRLAHAFRELESAGLTEIKAERVVLTPVGDELYRLITVNPAATPRAP